MEETTTRRRRESRAKRRARILRNRIIFGTACVCLTAGIVAGGLASASRFCLRWSAAAQVLSP